MTTIHSYLSSDHRHCDESLANIEVAVLKKRWDEVLFYSKQFNNEMNRHFFCEETILFPAFENAIGMTSGPTVVMRMEHIKIREMLEQIPEMVLNKNSDRLLGITETLMIFIQQHNNKEEQMLYNMCDMHLSIQAEDLITNMKNVQR